MNLLAQAAPPPDYNFWGLEPGSQKLQLWLIGALVFGGLMVFLMTFVPTRARKPIVWTFTFLAGGFYILYWLWPQPIAADIDHEIPRNSVESVGFWLSSAQLKVADVSNVLAAFLLGLGVFSILSIHLKRIFKKHEDRFFSIVLIVSMLAMIWFGYADWILREFRAKEVYAATPTLMVWENQGFDLMFDGMLQQMDAAMFSMIAFFILSAAYRAFRVRSVEATVLMASALILMFSLMGAVETPFAGFIDSLTANTNSAHVPDPGHWLNNLKIATIGNWVKSFLQVPSLRALEFGVGLGALAMGLRLWLGLEKGGIN
jgi:hypothetical protein